MADREDTVGMENIMDIMEEDDMATMGFVNDENLKKVLLFKDFLSQGGITGIMDGTGIIGKTRKK